jgi:adenosylhomocysteine nucleosidase
MSERARTVGVICAMESEAVHLRNRLQDTVELPVSRWRRTRGRIGSTAVDIVVCGIGLINAAAATTALLTVEPPDAVINYGCSGAHREDINPGDIVIASSVVHFSSLLVLPTGERKYWGFRYDVNGERVLTDTIPANPDLLTLARRAGERIDIMPWPGQTAAPVVHEGIVGSADIWTQHTESIRELHGLHGSLCEEMEAAAIGQVCAIYGVPFLAVKDISNNEFHSFTDLSTEQGTYLVHVEEEVGKRAAILVEAVIRELA